MSIKRVCQFLALMMVPVLLAVGYGFSAEGSAAIGYNGKGSAVLTFESELAPAEFREELDEALYGFNVVSGDDDMLTAEAVEQTQTGYEVTVRFRRLDKIKLNGDFYLERWSEYVAEGSESLALLEKLDRGNLSCTVSAHFDGVLGQITVPRSTTERISPYTAAGEATELEAFVAEGRASAGNAKMLLFRLFGLEGLTRAEVTVPGQIRAYGGNVNLLSGNTFEVFPGEVNATVLRNKLVVDENGTEKFEAEVTNEAVSMLVGYIVFDQDVDPAVYWLIGIAAAVVVGLCVAVYVYFRRAGLKILQSEGQSKEGKENGNGEN